MKDNQEELYSCPLGCGSNSVVVISVGPKTWYDLIGCQECKFTAHRGHWQNLPRAGDSVKAIANELRRDFHSAAAAYGLAVKLVQITSRLDSLAKEECERSHCDTDECAWVGAIDGIAEVLEMEEYSFATEVLEAVRRRSRVVLPAVCMECQGTGLSGNDPNTPCPNGCQEPSK